MIIGRFSLVANFLIFIKSKRILRVVFEAKSILGGVLLNLRVRVSLPTVFVIAHLIRLSVILQFLELLGAIVVAGAC